MNVVTILLLVTTLIVLIGAGFYFLKVRVKAADLGTQCIGFTYHNASPRASPVLSKVQNVMSNLQAVTCAFVKPAWKNMKPTLLIASKIGTGTGTGTSTESSCSAQKEDLLALIKESSIASTSTIPLSELEKDKVRVAIISLLNEVLDQTCDKDTVNVEKATALMDEIVAAVC